jgi:hypothetical protein
MSYFQVRNSLNPSKVIVCGITFDQVVPKGNEGEALWVLEVATDEPHITTSGTIPSYYINVTSETDIDLEIEKAVAEISKQVDWSPLSSDTTPPYVTSVSPATYIVPINQNVEVVIEELHPSVGIDIDTIEMYVDGVNVTDDIFIDGTELRYRMTWQPPFRVYTQYEE